ncbi:hypothetical protein [Paracoccus laeviglucosivorans]|uniref:hypothetical protein n=1 Tax=Paracoccus laeviglucosivorans TaxID=1197861 RepID=UPI001159DA9C|nr:hypothetical protein [Paracoccus laeviglucosivorans]
MARRIHEKTYLDSPDMIAFTLGRVVAMHISRNLEISHFHIRASLGEIIDAETDNFFGNVSREMALSAMAYLNNVSSIARDGKNYCRRIGGIDLLHA